MTARTLTLAVVASLWLLSANADVQCCGDVQVDSVADQRGSAATVCRVAERVSSVLRVCGLDVLDPIPVYVVSDLPAECPPHALGYFDARDATVTIPTYTACVALAGPDGRLGVPITSPLYESLIAHELVHATVSQHQRRTALNRAGHEYLAYATQFVTMAPALRARILARFPQADPVRLDELSEVYLDLAPDRFAVKSYLHFVASKDRCGLIEDLLEGRRALRSGLR